MHNVILISLMDLTDYILTAIIVLVWV